MIIHDIPAGSLSVECLYIPDFLSEKWHPYTAGSVADFATEKFKPAIALFDSLVKLERIRASYCRLDSSCIRIRAFILINSKHLPHAQFVHAQNLVKLIDMLDLEPQKFSGATATINVVLRQPVLCNVAPKDLLDIFIHMPSPSPNYDLMQSLDSDLSDLLNDCLEQRSPHGMKTTLYPYQKRSIWKILQRELAPQLVGGLTTAKCQAVDGKIYYINLLTCQVQMQSEKYSDVSGGIICEDMGTGKTCICLATILHTKYMRIPSQNMGIQTDLVPKNRCPSLRDIAIEQMLRNGDWKRNQLNLPDHLIKIIKENPAYYERVENPMPLMIDRPRRVNVLQKMLKVYMASTTLVVVPDNLIAQWTGEVYKHIEDGELDFLVLDNKKQAIPPATKLLEYDVVIISHSRFGLESESGGLEFVGKFKGIPRKCNCPYFGASRVKDCSCDVPDDSAKRYVSPLLQVHWKRMIVDEGHSLADNNRSSQLSSRLFATWKWICTGTPTQNLTESPVALTRKQAQEDDLRRLGVLLSNVLHLEPFASTKRAWNTILLRPFMNGNPRASIAVAGLMRRIMIRNRREDISRDVTLPQLYKRLVFLDFDYYQWMAHNCQVAMIALNAILSRREGVDYLFSRGNQKALRETVNNLWQSCLWHSIDPKWLQPAYDNCMEKIQDVEQERTTYGDEDNQGLVEISNVLRRAIDDKLFLSMMSTHSPSYLIYGLPDIPKKKWSWLGGHPGVYVDNDGTQSHSIVGGDTVVDITAEIAHSKENTSAVWVYDDSKDTLDTLAVHNRKRKLELAASAAENGEEQPKQLAFIGAADLESAILYSTSSSKLNYLVNQIKKHHQTEKCIIFSQHWNEIQEIFTALRLVKVRALMYLDSKMSNAERSQTILTFNTSDQTNVIIMSVQVAAYGIDLSSASRVYFVSPVWQTAMEQQAIKRAHRIGQTKPVYVETIVIRSSIEENMLKRRAMLAVKAEKKHGSEHQQAPVASTKEFFNDRKMQDILNHASFVPLPRNIHEVQEEEKLTVSQPTDPFHTPVPLVKLDKASFAAEQDKDDQTTALANNEILSTSKSRAEDTDVTTLPRKRLKVSFQLPE